MADELASLKLTHKKLRLEPVEGADMFTASGVLTIPECQTFITAAEALGFQHQGSGGPAAGEAFRDNQRTNLQDPELAQRLWHQTGLAVACQQLSVDGSKPCGLNPNLRFYRYDPGQRFGRHIDDSVDLDEHTFTGYTLLVYLSGQTKPVPAADVPSPGSTIKTSKAANSKSGNSKAGNKRGRKGHEDAAPQLPQGWAPCTEAVQELLGGETVFYGARGRCVASITPAPGLALLHLHGEERCLEHEARAVVRGCKYVLRSDVVFQR